MMYFCCNFEMWRLLRRAYHAKEQALLWAGRALRKHHACLKRCQCSLPAVMAVNALNHRMPHLIRLMAMLTSRTDHLPSDSLSQWICACNYFTLSKGCW
jgi:hypothetical protein